AKVTANDFLATTFTVAVEVELFLFLVAVSVYVVVAVGETVTDVLPVTSPTPWSMLSVDPLSAAKMSCAESPSAMLDGTAVNTSMLGGFLLLPQAAANRTASVVRLSLFMDCSRAWRRVGR